MRVETLPKFSVSKKDENGQPALNIVSVTNTKAEGLRPGAYANGVTVVVPDNKKGFTFNIPADLFQYNQYDALSEHIVDCGGEPKALDVANAFKRDSACDTAKAEIRTSTNKDVDAVVRMALQAALSHSFEEAARIDAKEFAKFGRDLQANIETMSESEIVAALKKQLGLA